MSFINRKKNNRKKNRQLILTVSMFLLGNEKLKNLFWNVKTVKYKKAENEIKIGINTIKKLGTTLSKLRAISKDLSNYLFDNGITYRRQTKIIFYVDKADEQINQVLSIIENVEKSNLS